MALQVRIIGLEKFSALAKTTAEMRSKVHSGLLQRMRLLGEAVKARAQEKYLAGRPGLNVVTGNLSSRISYSVKDEGNSMSVEVGTNVIYGKVHEYGKTIRPVNGKYLSFIGREGKRVFVRQVVIPPRPWLRPSIQEELPIFAKRVDEFLKSAAKEALSGVQ